MLCTVLGTSTYSNTSAANASSTGAMRKSFDATSASTSSSPARCGPWRSRSIAREDGLTSMPTVRVVRAGAMRAQPLPVVQPMPARGAAPALAPCPPFEVVYSNDPVTPLAFQGHEAEVRTIPHQNREAWQGATIRARMAAGDPAWREAVPEPVVAILDELDGEARLVQLERNQRDTETQSQEGRGK